MRKVVAIVAALVLLEAALMAYPPARIAVGRHSPAIASFVSPWFAFHHKYMDGYVVGFEVGSQQDVVFRHLRDRYAGQARVIAGCRVTTAASLVDVTRDTDVGSVYGGGERLCLSIGSDPIYSRWSLVFAFDEEGVVRSIEVTFSRVEAP